MDKLLPSVPGTRSGWSTENHYFYEIVNRTGKSVYIQLALSSKEMPEDQLEISERINEFYPAKWGKKDWQWRILFSTKSVAFDNLNDREAVFAVLDSLLPEIEAFEVDLGNKLTE